MKHQGEMMRQRFITAGAGGNQGTRAWTTVRKMESWLSCMVAAGTMEETARDTTEAEREEWKYPTFSPSPVL